jgi:hypothetical protein
MRKISCSFLSVYVPLRSPLKPSPSVHRQLIQTEQLSAFPLSQSFSYLCCIFLASPTVHLHAVFGKWGVMDLFPPTSLNKSMKNLWQQDKRRCGGFASSSFSTAVFGPINNDDVAGGSRLCFAYA